MINSQGGIQHENNIMGKYIKKYGELVKKHWAGMQTGTVGNY
jgi:hypothetical protein